MKQHATAVDTSDIDILVEIPQAEYQRYDYQKGNGQSRLLQAVRNAILASYPRTDIRADGQVVKVSFSDGMKMEILPAFPQYSYWGMKEGYTYPDSNDGGRWLSTNPKAEQEAMKAKNTTSSGLLFDTCKHLRYVRDNYFTATRCTVRPTPRKRRPRRQQLRRLQNRHRPVRSCSAASWPSEPAPRGTPPTAP